MGNHVWVSGDVLKNSDLTMTTGSNIKDDSGTQTLNQPGSAPKNDLRDQQRRRHVHRSIGAPGDTVTYRLTLDLATSNFDELTLADYLPLPTYTATTVTSWSYGPLDTFHHLAADARRRRSARTARPIASCSPTATCPDIPNHASTIRPAVQRRGRFRTVCGWFVPDQHGAGRTFQHGKHRDLPSAGPLAERADRTEVDHREGRHRFQRYSGNLLSQHCWAPESHNARFLRPTL